MIGFRRLVPLMNRVLVKKVEVAQKSAGGIILASKEMPPANIGTVLDVGPGTTDKDGKHRKWLVKVGDTVLLPEHAGAKVELADKSEFYLYRDDDIIGVLSERV